ncbi:MAG: hypothetical protein IPN08_13365 [Bacteroidales bacterium]|nr:hypothetical protein [Bacteroidales bacterium]
MEAILIFRQPDSDEIPVIEDKLCQPDYFAVISAGLQYSGKLNHPGPLPESISQRANRELLKSILAFGDRMIGQQTVGQLLDMGSFPIWHYQRFRIYFRLKPLFVLRNAIDHYLNEADRVTVYCDAAHADLLQGTDNRIHFIPGPPEKKLKLNIRPLLGYLIYFKIKILLNILFPPDFTDKKHLLVDRSVRQRCRHPETLRLKFDNYTLSNLLDKSGNDFLIVNEAEPPKLKGSGTFKLSAGQFAGLGRRSRSISGEYIMLRGLLSFSLYREKKKMITDLEFRIGLILSSELSGTEALIFNAFTALSATNSFFISRFLAYRRFFRKHRFLTVAAIDENSPATRCILDAARSTGAKSIGIQHGNIGEAQPAYLYTEKDRTGNIMADLTLVWGEYWREFLIQKGNYPGNSIVITGQVRTDIIPQLRSNPAMLKEEFAATKPLAVFASQPIPDPAIRRKAAADVFSAFSELPGFELIVKLHPAEKDDVEYYREIAISAGCEDYRILYDVDLYSLLAASDLVITCYSTVGTEAVYFGKPLIIVDPLKEDLLGYHRSGIAWQALNEEDIRHFAEGVLYGLLKPDHAAMQLFIEKYAYRIDGQVCERTLSVIRGVGSGTVH